jgi:hypothetical protein
VTTLNIPADTSGEFSATVTANTILALGYGPATTTVEVGVLITQDATGGRVVTLPGFVQWATPDTPGNTTPVVAQGATQSTYLRFRWAPVVGWLGVAFVPNIAPHRTALPANVPGTSTPAYMTGYAYRFPEWELSMAGHMAAVTTWVPTAIRQGIQTVGVTYELARTTWEGNIAWVDPNNSGTYHDRSWSAGGSGFTSTTYVQVYDYYQTTSWGTLSAANARDHIVVHETAHAVDFRWGDIHYGGAWTFGGSAVPNCRNHPTIIALYAAIQADAGYAASAPPYGKGHIAEWWAEMLSFYWQGATDMMLVNCANNTTLRTQFVAFLTSVGLA